MRSNTTALMALAVCCCLGRLEASYDAADRIGLIPTPREITIGPEQIDLAGWRILLTDESVLCRVGAEEINDRLTALGANTLPVSTTVSDEPPRIVVGTYSAARLQRAAAALSVSLTPTDPGAQGYVIACGRLEGTPVVLAGGSDEQGALYACVTLRRMIQKVDGQVRLLSGRVRDWPNYKVRCNGLVNLRLIKGSQRPETMERTAQSLRAQIDFYLRHKVNYVHANAYWLGPTPDERTRAARRAMVEVSRYARSRGIRTRVVGNTEIGGYLTPEQKKGAVQRRSGACYVWSALDAHRRHARDLAEYLRDAQVGVFALHPVDSGGYLDPETWSHRSPSCKAMYGNHRARASLEQFKLYFDIIREECPDIELEAVSYPYHYQFAMPGFVRQAQDMGADMPSMGWVRGIEDAETARRVQQELCQYHRDLSKGLRKDVTITFREARRDIFLACADLYDGHPVTIWIYPERNKGWRGTFCPQVRMAKSFWRSDVRDHYFVASSWGRGNDARVQRLAQQEYLWSVDRPDASADFTAGSRWYETEGRQVTKFQRERLIPRICRILYGSAAPVFQELVEANVSLNYVLEPAAVASEGGENFDETMEYMAEQAETFHRLHQEFAALISRMNGAMVFPPDAEAWTLYWLKFTGIAAIKAKLEFELGRCRSLLSRGSTDEALQVVAGLRKELPAMQQRKDAIHARVDKDQRHTKESGYNRSVDNMLHVFQPAEYSAELDQLERQAVAAASLGVIPPHVAKQLQGRKIEVCRFVPSYGLKVDAHRGEGGWTNSQTVDFFTVGGERLAQFETSAWVLWDDEALYFYVHAFDPNNLNRRPTVPAATRDGSVFKDDCFEVFLDTNGDRRTYYHLALSSSGAKYDAAKTGEGSLDVSWDGDWEAAVVRGRDLWIAEIHVPFSMLGGPPKPGDVWHTNMSRHRAARPGSQSEEDSSLIPSERNHRPDLFLPLVFTSKSRADNPSELRARIDQVKRYDQTTTYGYSTFLVFTPTVESDRSLVNQTIRIQVADAHGKVVAKKRIEAVRIPGQWSPSKPVMMDLGQAYEGDLTLTLSCGDKSREREVQSFRIGTEG